MKQLFKLSSCILLGISMLFVCPMMISAQDSTNHPKLVKPSTFNAEKTKEVPTMDTNSNNSSNQVYNEPQKLTAGSPKEVDEVNTNNPAGNPGTFEPIPASGYTDPNYQANLEKSQEVEHNLNSTVDVQIIPPTLEEYILERDKYQENTVEYNQLQQKIDALQSNSNP